MDAAEQVLDALYGGMLAGANGEGAPASSDRSDESGIIRIVDADEATIVRERLSHIAHCESEIERLEARKDVIEELLEKTKEKLQAALNAERRRTGKRSEAEIAAEREVERRAAERRAKVNVTRPAPVRVERVEEPMRDAIVSLGIYTVSELAARLGLDKRKCREAHARFLEREQTRKVGSFAGEPRYEYQAPVEPGEAFELGQQAGLTGATVTPISSARGAPVPYTGKPVGASGKPGRDREKARQGRRIKTKHGKA